MEQLPSPVQEVSRNGGFHQHDNGDEGFFATSDIEERALNERKQSGRWDDILNQRASTTNTVSLSRCNLQTLPVALTSLVQLTRLYLTYNELRELPREFGQLRLLTILNLGFNQFEAIPSAIFKLINLQVLFMKNNRLKCIRDEIKLLTNLEELYLDNNQIDEFPEPICWMANLRLLSVNNNSIQTFPRTIEGMRGLKVLKMRSNLLKEIPAEFGQLKALELACFAQNMIDSFPLVQVDNMCNLRDLCLYANRLRDRHLLERCVYQMEERGGLFRAEENRVMLPRAGGVCDVPFRIWKYDIVWLHDGEDSVQSWIGGISQELRNQKLTPQDYGPRNDKLKASNLQRSRIVAVFCTSKMCQLLSSDEERLRATLLEYFRVTPVGNNLPALWVIVDRKADVSRFFYDNQRQQNVLLEGDDDEKLCKQLVNIICTGSPSPPEAPSRL